MTRRKDKRTPEQKAADDAEFRRQDDIISEAIYPVVSKLIAEKIDPIGMVYGVLIPIVLTINDADERWFTKDYHKMVAAIANLVEALAPETPTSRPTHYHRTMQ